MDKVELQSRVTAQYDRQAYNKVLSLVETQINKGADGYLFGVRALTASATLLQGDNILIVDATTGAVTVTLPDAYASEQKIITVKKIDATANAVTVVPIGTSKIDGAANKSTTTQWAAFRYTALNGQWYIV